MGWVAARGPVIESLTWVRLPDVYYALKRYADYIPKGAKAVSQTPEQLRPPPKSAVTEAKPLATATATATGG